MTKTLIGTATTDSSGKATFTYTGVGAGQLEISAETSDGSIVSEPYPLIDALVYDGGVTGNNNNSIWQGQFQATATVSDDGTLFSTSGGNGQGILANKPNTTTSDLYDWDKNIAIEFDVVAITGDPYFQIRDSSSNSGTYYLQSKGVTANSHVKFTYTDDATENFKMWIDDTPISNPPTITTNSLVRIGVVVGLAYNIKIKNFKIYSI